MKYSVLLVPFIVVVNTISIYAHTNSIDVSCDKITTLVFEEEIIDVELGSSYYDVKVKGRYLLLRAQEESVAPTSLFVRYESKPQHYYVAELAPSKEAPLQYIIPLDTPKQATKPAEERPSPFTDTTQEYFDVGAVHQGIRLILNKLLHVGEVTWMQCYIDNTTEEDLHFNVPQFVYVTVERRGYWSQEEKRRLVVPLKAPSSFVVPAKRGKYVAFSIPIYTSRERLVVYLEKRDGEKLLKCTVLNRVLREANRQ